MSGSEVDAHTGTVGGLSFESVHLWLISLLCESVSVSLILPSSPARVGLFSLKRFSSNLPRLVGFWREL